MRVLVCGGRSYGMMSQRADIAEAQENRLREVLDKLHAEAGIGCIIEGGAAGADHLAFAWAAERRVAHEQYPADWETHGSFAGPMRNAQMLIEGKPDVVIAFPGMALGIRVVAFCVCRSYRR
jgi:hypothetical protein